MKHKLALYLVFILSLMVITACGSSSNETVEVEETKVSSENAQTDSEKPSYTFKLAHIENPNSDWQKTAEQLNKELNELSDGRMTVEIFPAGQLGPEADMVNQLTNGSIDFGIITNAYMGTRSFDNLNAWFMPFLFSSIEDASKMRDSSSAKEMLAELESQGIIGLDYIFAGNHNVLMEDGGMVSSPEDVKGKKMRIIGNPVIQDFWVKAGASPTSLPLPDVYMALETGVVDGVHMSIDGTATSKFFEVANDFTLLNQISFPAIIMISKQSYEKLSEEDQEIVKEAVKNAADWGVEKVIASEEEFLNELENEGLNIHTIEELDPGFQEIRDAMYKEYSDSSPLIKQFIEEAQAQ